MSLLLIAAASGDGETVEWAAWILLFAVPIVHLGFSLLARWWDWRTALVFCAVVCLVYLLSCLLPTSYSPGSSQPRPHTDALADYLIGALVVFAWPLPGWIVGRGIRAVKQRGWI